MSYDIYIGEGVWSEEDWGVHGFTLSEAPAFRGDRLSKQCNSRHPGYLQWGGFLDRVGLYELFFGVSGLMAEHPGACKLKPQHLYLIHNALEKYQASKPSAKPGLCGCKECSISSYTQADGLAHEDLDYDLARLQWLDWWVMWAIQNCSNPTLVNL